MSKQQGGVSHHDFFHRRHLDSALTVRLLRMSKSRPFIAYTAVSALLMALYFFVIAAPIYVSNASFTVQGRASGAAGGSGATLMSAVTGSSHAPANLLSEPAAITDYIASPQVMLLLDHRYHLRELYSRPRLDLIHWMPRNASQEDFLKFYRRMVVATYDDDDLIMRLEVRSFSAKSAHDIADGVLHLTNDFIDGMSARIRSETVRTAQEEVTKAQQAANVARLTVTRYRASAAVLDPNLTAAAQQSTISNLQQQLVSAKSDRAALAAYSNPGAPMMLQADAKVAALQAQVDRQQSALTGQTQQPSTAEKLYGYVGLLAADQYQTQRLASAQQNFDAAKVDALQQQRFLVRAVNPSYPDSAAEPERLLGFTLGLLACLALYSVLLMIIGGVQDLRKLS